MNNYNSFTNEITAKTGGVPMPELARAWGEPGGGLTYSNKVLSTIKNKPVYKKSVVTMRNKYTGEMFSTDSAVTRRRHMQKRICTWAKVTDSEYPASEGYITQMSTLTYRPGVKWAPGQIRGFEIKLKKRYKSLVAYAWVAELTKAGNVHYHVLTILKNRKIGFLDKNGLWTCGHTRVEMARSKFYLVHYVGKEYQKTGPFPKGLRMYGMGFAMPLSPKNNYELRSSAVPYYVIEKSEAVRNDKVIRKESDTFDEKDFYAVGWHRMKGGFRLDYDDCEDPLWIPSPFELVSVDHEWVEFTEGLPPDDTSLSRVDPGASPESTCEGASPDALDRR